MKKDIIKRIDLLLDSLDADKGYLTEVLGYLYSDEQLKPLENRLKVLEIQNFMKNRKGIRTCEHKEKDIYSLITDEGQVTVSIKTKRELINEMINDVKNTSTLIDLLADTACDSNRVYGYEPLHFSIIASDTSDYELYVKEI